VNQRGGLQLLIFALFEFEILSLAAPPPSPQPQFLLRFVNMVNTSLGKRKHDRGAASRGAAPFRQTRLQKAAAASTARRSRRRAARKFDKLNFDNDDDDEEEEEEDDEEGEEEEDDDEEEEEEEDEDDHDHDDAPAPVVVLPPQLPRDIDSKKLPVLLSLVSICVLLRKPT
jgi:hypothetical protein